MCVAIFQHKGAVIPRLNLQKGFNGNRDGAGFCYVDPETQKVKIERGFMKFEALEEAYYAAVKEYGEVSPFLVHMRIRTSGHISAKNTHPFPIRGGAMIHNGTFFSPSKKYQGPTDDLKSDTRVLAEHLHDVLTYEDVLAAQERILGAVGRFNKMVFLYDDGRHLILNEKAGVWADNIWYSNSSCYIPPSIYTR